MELIKKIKFNTQDNIPREPLARHRPSVLCDVQKKQTKQQYLNHSMNTKHMMKHI